MTAPSAPSEALREIENIEKTMQYVEEAVQSGTLISEHFIRELQAMVVKDLTRDGDRTPGAYRSGMVTITKAMHLPPEAVQVPGNMQELVEFVNHADPTKYDLMKVALAHHRFAWVHPFGNGNGSVVRLLTYALLIKYGFRVSTAGRVLNPAAVFCADCEQYYAMLAKADSGSDEALESWCTYVLTGVRDELKKVDRLTDYEHLKTHVLLPALAFARQRELVTAQEEAVLSATIKAGVTKAGNLASSMPDLNTAGRTYQIKKLVVSGMLQPIKRGARRYTIGFSHNTLLRGIIEALATQDFIPAALKSPAT